MIKLLKNSFILIIFIFCLIFKNSLGIILLNVQRIITNTPTKVEIINEVISYENKTLKEEIKKLSNLKKDNYLTSNYLIGRMINIDIYEAINQATLLLGSVNNIEKDMIIMNNDGLVGIVSDVKKDFSIIELITSNNPFSIKINNNYGIIDYYKETENIFIISKMDNLYEISVGDIVSTSGLGKYPADIIVGQVKSIHDNQNKTTIYVTPTINLKNIDYVIVLGAKKG